MIVAVDFGTTRTKVAYLDQAGNPTIIPNARGDETTPTVVHYQADGNHLIGRDAEEQGYLEPELCMKNLVQLQKSWLIYQAANACFTFNVKYSVS